MNKRLCLDLNCNVLELESHQQVHIESGDGHEGLVLMSPEDAQFYLAAASAGRMGAQNEGMQTMLRIAQASIENMRKIDDIDMSIIAINTRGGLRTVINLVDWMHTKTNGSTALVGDAAQSAGAIIASRCWPDIHCLDSTDFLWHKSSLHHDRYGSLDEIATTHGRTPEQEIASLNASARREFLNMLIFLKKASHGIPDDMAQRLIETCYVDQGAFEDDLSDAERMEDNHAVDTMSNFDRYQDNAEFIATGKELGDSSIVTAYPSVEEYIDRIKTLGIDVNCREPSNALNGHFFVMAVNEEARRREINASLICDNDGDLCVDMQKGDTASQKALEDLTEEWLSDGE